MPNIRLTALMASCAALAIAQPAHAQLGGVLGGGKPKIPEQREIDTYDEVIGTENITLAPVRAGLVPHVPSDEEMQVQKLNPDLYRNTLNILQQYMNRIAELGPRSDVVPRVKLELSDRPDAYTPNNEEVFVTTGMITALLDRNLSERDFQSALAFIMGHEYAHVLYDHPARFAEKEDSIKLTEGLSTALVYSSQLQELTSLVSPELAQANQDATDILATATALSPMAESELYRIGIAPYHKDQESRADFMSADLMRNLSGANGEFADVMNPRTGADFLTVLQEYDNSVFGQLEAGLEHLEDSMKQAGEDIEDQTEQLGATLDVNSFFAGVQASVVKNILKFAVDIFGRRYNKDKIHLYYSSDKRRDGVGAYLDTFYEPIPDVVDEEIPAEFFAFNDFGTSEDLAEAYHEENAADEAASRANLAYMQGNVAGARAILDEIDASTVASVHYHVVDGAIWRAAGNAENAEQSFSRAIQYPEAGMGAYRDLTTTQMGLEHFVEAEQTLDAAEAKFTPQDVIVLRIQLRLAQEDLEGAQELAETCAAMGDKDLTKQCEDTIPEVEDEEKEGKGLGIGLGGIL